MSARIRLLTRNWLLALLQPKPLIGLLYLPRFFRHWIEYARKAKAQKPRLLDSHPCLSDWCSHTPFDPHYFYQGAWLSRKVVQSKPEHHVDIGSSVLTISILSAAVNTIFVDYRPLKASISGLISVAGDILMLPFPNDSVKSLSCLHVIEHIGLGRYGDSINPDGSIEAAIELQRILCTGGKLYVSLPIGRERTCFNGHRVHAPESVVRMFRQLNLVEFSYVDDEGCLRENQTTGSANALNYGCGLFHFEKLL
jgi:hypothetical protein